VGSNTNSPGSSVSVANSLSSNTNIVAVQYDVLFNASLLSSDSVVAGNVLNGHVLASSLLNPQTRRVVLYSMSNAQLTNGILANLVFSIATNAPVGSSSLILTNAIFANARGDRVAPVSLLPGSVTISLTTPARFGTILLSTNGTVQFDIIGTPNLTYIIQASTNLTQWLDVSTNVATGGTINFTDYNAIQFPYRFYRVKSAQ